MVTCPACGKSLPSDAVFCLACGRRLPGPDASSGMPASAHVGKTCPYCQTPLKPHDRVVVCPQCGMPHHQDCWQDNDGCTTYGCESAAAPPPTMPGDDRIDLTGMPLPEPSRPGRTVKPPVPLFVITVIILMVLLLLFVFFESMFSAMR
ncbi:MAG: RING finger protein [Armatimonadota bacterium]